MRKITIDEDYLNFLLKQERIRGKIEWNDFIFNIFNRIKTPEIIMTTLAMKLSDEVCDFSEEQKKWIKSKD